ncbi:MAG TPA: hypothetical protein VJ915_05450 [Balneolaceae bacterium]|nr:hypothetical protein [Balneolaceae bacterium]
MSKINAVICILILILSFFVIDNFVKIDDRFIVEKSIVLFENTRQEIPSEDPDKVEVSCIDSVDLSGWTSARICLKDNKIFCKISKYNNVIGSGTCTYEQSPAEDEIS